MNTLSEETPRVKSSGSAGSSGGKNRRRITTSGKSSGEEVNSILNYLRTSTGSCHDFWSNAGIEKKEIKTVKKLIPKGIPSLANDENLNDVGTTVRPTPVGNTPGMSLYANVTGEPCWKALNFRTLFTLRGNRLLDVFNNSGLGVAKNLKKPSQAPRCVLVGSKVGFKRVKQAYRPVSIKHAANTNGSKKNDVEPTKKVSISNLFNVLNSVENDMDLGTNRGTSNLQIDFTCERRTSCPFLVLIRQN
ncbi:hypothetical protein Tco_1465138 [Tanacetum coccineum]